MSLIDHLSRARDAATTDDAVAALLAAWRETPAAAIAELIEQLDAGADAAVIDGLRAGSAAGSIGAIASLEDRDGDPRIAAAIVRLLQDPPWHATGSQPFWTVLFRVAAKHLDPRFRQTLLKLPARYTKIINGKSMRGWMQERIRSLAERFPKPRPLATDADKILKSIGPKKGTARPPQNEKRDVPDDDAARAVHADALIQKGDPRGEFIALQLAGDPDSLARADKLLKKHRAAWIGELGSVVNHDWSEWRRGFLAVAAVKLSLPKLEQLGASPLWATVEALSLRMNERDSWKDAFARWLTHMPLLRRIDDLPVRTIPWIPPAVAARLEDVRLWLPEDGDLDEALRRLEGFASLRVLGLMSLAEGPRDDLSRVIAHPLFARLDRFWFEVANASAELDRRTWHLAVARANRPALLEAFTKLPIKTISGGEYVDAKLLAKKIAPMFPKAKA